MLGLQVLLCAPEPVIHNQDIEALLVGLREKRSENITQIVERTSPGLFLADLGEVGQVALPRLWAFSSGDPGTFPRANPFPSPGMIRPLHGFTLSYHHRDFLLALFGVSGPEDILKHVENSF